MAKNLYSNFHENTSIQGQIVKNNNFTYRNIIPYIDKYQVSKKNVLDIGCGAGTLCFYIASMGNRVMGVDISPKAIKVCQQSSKKLGLDNLTDFKVVNFPEESIKGKFDLVIITEVIEHIIDDSLALDSIFSILNKHGIVIITTPSSNAPLYRLGYAKGFDKRVGHLRRYTTENLIKKSESSGFRIVETEKIEGLLRNFLFLSPFAGKFIRFIKYYISDVITFMDNLLIPIFGESNIVLILKKP